MSRFAHDDTDKKETKSRPVKTMYGIGQGAELNTEKEKTEGQEYRSGGLPETDKYTVDKKGGSQ